MLVVTRRTDETIEIGENVEVKVLAVSAAGKVRIGITAPPQVRVLRGELADRERSSRDQRPLRLAA
jgi:carbon storage regulator